ncbi:hypothetical protein DERP_013248 [Dermatophagoides pteronyssinus]|uniref:Uncharacterized protein n=1 Tax=Dermatophagoides pteronyssinus TaxID=6956 RepID=A0ABQ8IRI4_DERPT|nr:hypothetical protein DERP_013248 [Dermatophagoides pteronyssinus]
MDPYLKNSDIIDNFDHIEIQIIPNDFLSKNIDNDSNESTIDVNDDNNDNHNCLIVFWHYIFKIFQIILKNVLYCCYDNNQFNFIKGQ